MTLPPLPWAEVNAKSSAQVAELLGLARAGGPEGKQGKKWACIACDSSDALHAYPRRFYCFSCGWKGSNIDAAAARWGLEPAEACKELARSLGVPLPPDPQQEHGARAARGLRRTPHARTDTPCSATRKRPDRKAELQAEVNTIRAAGRKGGCTPPEVYAAALTHLELTGRGAEYLARRGFDPAAAAAYGFRSLDGPRDWVRLAEALAEVAAPVALELAGFYSRAEGRPPYFKPPFRVPALVIPFMHAGEVAGVRFRNLTPDAEPRQRYRDLPGSRPPIPFNADALDAEELHITEGELDAYTLHLHGLAAVGVPGAHGWRDEWAAMMKPAGRLVLWYDNDQGGDNGARRAAARLQEAHGSEWVKGHARRVRLPADVNELHTQGALHGRIERAAWRD